MPVNEVVNGILQEIGGKTDAVEIEAVTEIFHIAGRDDTPLWEGLSAEARKALRNYLNAAVPAVLAQDDFGGQLKGYFATVIAQVGELSDLATIERLVEADIERVRTGRLARAADHRSKQGNGAVMSWTSWYVQAMIHLASDAARDLLIRLLTAPDYEHDAAWVFSNWLYANVLHRSYGRGPGQCEAKTSALSGEPGRDRKSVV